MKTWHCIYNTAFNYRNLLKNHQFPKQKYYKVYTGI